MKKFYKEVPEQRGAMEEFLREHERYFTMNSWNRLHSYANCVKIHRLELTKTQLETAYDIISCDESSFYDELKDMFDDFEVETGFPVGMNGRSSGYIVLYSSDGTVKGLDQDKDCEDWDDEDLLERVKLVQAFDKLCDECVEVFADYCDRYKAVEKEIMVPKKIMVLEEK
jgi:hypothetical protein